MSKNTKEQEIPYSYLVDNIKIFLIFLVVFNHIIAFQLVKADQVVRFVWYGITIFHMPAFIFISGYLSKKPQDVMKNVKNLLIPYILGYTLTWAAQIWLGNRMDYEPEWNSVHFYQLQELWYLSRFLWQDIYGRVNTPR